MYMTKERAHQMEDCIKQSHIEYTQSLPQGRILEINGGAACFSGFNSYLSQVIGWGFRTKYKQLTKEIKQIEDFYKALAHPRVDIELCPYTGTDIAHFLSQRGYKITELNNVSFIDLKDYQALPCTDEPRVHTVSKDDLAHWAQQVAAGFGFPNAQEQFFHYAQAKGVCAYSVSAQGQIVAGATLAVHDKVCDLGVTSTIPTYRGQGLQKKLLLARLHAAKKLGLHTATVTTEPGSISELNCQKVGFRCAYTRVKLTLEWGN